MVLRGLDFDAVAAAAAVAPAPIPATAVLRYFCVHCCALKPLASLLGAARPLETNVFRWRCSGGRYVLVQNVTSLAARKSMGQSNSVIDSVLLEAGQPGEEVVGENVVYLELGVDWTSYRSKVIP